MKCALSKKEEHVMAGNPHKRSQRLNVFLPLSLALMLGPAGAMGGQAARRVAKDGDLEVWAKDMEDGRKAVGLFNLDETQAVATVKWSSLGIRGKQVVRDLWRQKDIGTFNEQFAAPVGEYGVVLVSLRPVVSP